MAGEPAAAAETGISRPPPRGRYLALLSLGALGVVYGDIGTSPLYALRECFAQAHGVAPGPGNVLGVLSLIFWSLVLVISVKYLLFVLRADNRGEGGILALMALARSDPSSGVNRWLIVPLGLFGAALLYGDGMITPAITVLGALEGLHVATPIFDELVVPLAIVILIVLFLMQRRGTAGVGALFGPVMLVWFLVIAVLGIAEIFRHPGVLAAAHPGHAVRFFLENRWRGFLTLGSVFLVVTGGEALYADMGHFGARPIRLVWFGLVLPALLLNYFGQGALLLRDPAAAENPFFRMGPAWSLYPLVVLSTLAASIASQAVISGAFSLTRQAVLLGYAPRTEIRHTSSEEIGQIYIPSVNRFLMIGTILLVLGFRSAGNLAAAYGVAVTTTMGITTLLLFFVARRIWGWSPLMAALPLVVFLIIDLAFFGANIVKVAHGGWFPLGVAVAVFTMMTTWKRGRDLLSTRLEADTMPVDLFMQGVARRPRFRVPGTAIFMDRLRAGTPRALLHNYKHNRVLHERVVFLGVVTEEIPKVSRRKRLTIENLGEGFYRLTLRYGFREDPDVPRAIAGVELDGKPLNPMEVTFFLGRETLIPSGALGMPLWRDRLFGWMARNSTPATAFFRLPPNRVVELGAQIEI
jgi:KUP system potassium uptake protein